MKCLVCGMLGGKCNDHQICEKCQELDWKDTVLLLQLRKIAETLADIERCLPNKNKW